MLIEITDAASIDREPYIKRTGCVSGYTVRDAIRDFVRNDAERFKEIRSTDIDHHTEANPDLDDERFDEFFMG